MKEIVTHSENEERKTKEYHLAREREELLKFERHQLEQKEEFSKGQISTPDLPNITKREIIKARDNQIEWPGWGS